MQSHACKKSNAGFGTVLIVNLNIASTKLTAAVCKIICCSVYYVSLARWQRWARGVSEKSWRKKGKGHATADSGSPNVRYGAARNASLKGC